MVTIPYTMKEVSKASGKSGLTVAGSFSGCGGSSIGYKLAGFDVRYACEFDKHAAECYESAFPKTHLDRRSIAEVTGEEIIDACGGVPDIWEGSPPCSKFSTSGKREKGWNQVSKSDQSDQLVRNVEDLFFEWSRLLNEIRPKAAIAENVAGMLKGPSRGFAVEVLNRVKAMGYNCKIWKANAADFGVPQIRRRIFFVCWDPLRCLEPVAPKITDQVNAERAFAGLHTTVSDHRGKSTDLNDAPIIPRESALILSLIHI